MSEDTWECEEDEGGSVSAEDYKAQTAKLKETASA